MKKPGRPSAASHLSVVAPDLSASRPPITSLERLKPQEQKIFSFIAAENRHLRATDSVLLAAFARAATGLQNVDTAADFSKLAATCLSIGRSLRLTPQSRS